MNNIRTIIFFILIILSIDLVAQDKQFSQFYATPLILNPALTGGFAGRYRFALDYRTQGGNILDKPFNTIAAQIEFMFPLSSLLKRNRSDDKFGVGLVFFNDQIATIDYSTNQMIFSFGFHKSIDVSTKQYISIGYQLALAQRNLIYGNLTFQDQYNGIDAFSNSTLEVINIPENNYNYNDMNVGINYSITPQRGLSVYGGGAYHHFNNPEISFYGNDEDELIRDFNSFKLQSKITGHVGASIAMTRKVTILPKALYHKQGFSQQVNIGSNIRFEVQEYNSSGIQFGLWGRFVSHEKNVPSSFQSIIAHVGYETNGIKIGLSYDYGVTNLAVYGVNSNAIEFTLSYTGGEVDEDFVICPEF